MFKNLSSDYRAYKMTPYKMFVGVYTLSTFYLVALYRLGHFLHNKKVPILPAICRTLGIIFYSADISPSARIGPSFLIAHSVGIVIGASVEVKSNFEIFSNVTLGGRDKEIEGRTMPKIGSNVTIFSSASVIGPILIEDNSSIGANSVVLKNVPSNSVVAGVPAKIINQVEVPHALRSMG